MTNTDQLDPAAALTNHELMMRRAEIVNAFVNQVREQAIEVTQRMMPAINEAMQRAAEMMRAAAQAIFEWFRNVWPALYWLPEVQYLHGTPHQRHIAWRRLKRAGTHLPNPAR